MGENFGKALCLLGQTACQHYGSLVNLHDGMTALGLSF